MQDTPAGPPAPSSATTHEDPGARVDEASAEPIDPDARQVRDRLRARLFGIAAEPVKIGPYTLLSRIGAGGMGVVYAARHPDLDRTVALKLLHARGPRQDGDEGRARLLREARALARLSHPNVVAVYEVGALGDGVWLAMEYVDGVTLRTWLAEQPRRWPEVLRVMLAVGRGLAAAHAAGLVHRDFKPDNVMIGHDGRARVMDFGLARGAGAQADVEQLATFNSGSDHPLADLHQRVTRTGTLLGTPAYMAPEQLRRETADERADQFAFCVTLWEALFGARPFRGDTLLDLAAHVLRGELVPPRRRGVPRWLLRAVTRGLQPDPARRFPSMDALLSTLAHGRARARARGALVGLAVLAVAGLAAYAWTQHDRSRRITACDEAGAELEAVWNPDSKAALQRALLATGASYAATSYERAVPWVDRWAGDWARLRTQVCREADVDRTRTPHAYAQATECLHERRDELVALLAQLAEADRNAVQRVVEAAAGLSQLAPCADPAALARRVPLPADPELRAKISALRQDLARVHGQRATGRYASGLELAEATLTAATELGHRPLIAEASAATGILAAQAGKYERAEQASTAAFVEARSLGADELAAQAAISLVHTTGVHRARPAEGQLWGHVADAQLRNLGLGHTLPAANLLQALASVRALQGQPDEAIALAERGLQIRERELGPDHPDIGRSLHDLANILARQGAHAQALPRHERALQIWRATQSPDNPLIAFALGNLATLCSQMGQPGRARALYEEALQIAERALGPDHAFVAHTLGGLAVLASDHGDVATALALHERALAIQTKTLGPEHPAVALTLCNLADLHRARGSAALARPLYLRALEIWEKALGDRQPRLSYALVGLGELALTDGHPADAVPLLERAVELQATGAPLDLADARYALARAVWPTDRARAVTLADEAAAAYREAGAPKLAQLQQVDRWRAEHPTSGGATPRNSPSKKLRRP